MRVIRRERGFSVVELLIVVAIMLVLIAAALPSVNRTIQLWRLETSTAMVVAKIADARMNSIKRNRDSWLVFNAAAGTVQVQSTNPATGLPMNIGTAEAVRGGITLVPPPGNVTFNALGWPAAGAAQIRLLNLASAGGDQKNIIISAIGRVTVN